MDDEEEYEIQLWEEELRRYEELERLNRLYEEQYRIEYGE